MSRAPWPPGRERQCRPEEAHGVGRPVDSAPQPKRLNVRGDRIEVVVARPLESVPRLLDHELFGQRAAARVEAMTDDTHTMAAAGERAAEVED